MEMAQYSFQLTSLHAAACVRTLDMEPRFRLFKVERKDYI